jgi:hypothetical protein
MTDPPALRAGLLSGLPAGRPSSDIRPSVCERATDRDVEVHLPCPPLGEWLPERLSGLAVGAWAPSRAPRRLRRTLSQWPSVDAGPETGDGGERLARVDALMFGIRLERPAPPDACLSALRPGTLIIELALPRARVGRALLGLDPRPLTRARAGQARVLAWLARGYHGLEQWQSVDPQGVIVTLARVR